MSVINKKRKEKPVCIWCCDWLERNNLVPSSSSLLREVQYKLVFACIKPNTPSRIPTPFIHSTILLSTDPFSSFPPFRRRLHHTSTSISPRLHRFSCFSPKFRLTIYKILSRFSFFFF